MDQQRPCRVSRQREAGEATRRETRRRLLAAASEEFAERGYRAATVARIADRADVAVQTLYHSWGSKRALLRGVLELAVTGDEAMTLDGRALPRALLTALDEKSLSADPAALVRHLVHEFRVLAERASPVWGTYRDAAGVDPDVAADWRGLMELRRSSFARLIAAAPADGWARDLRVEEVVDTAWVIASPHTHELLVSLAGYTYDEYEAWVHDTIVAAVLTPAGRSRAS
jgi:AcrR family transcriptional regulator